MGAAEAQLSANRGSGKGCLPATPGQPVKRLKRANQKGGWKCRSQPNTPRSAAQTVCSRNRVTRAEHRGAKRRPRPGETEGLPPPKGRSVDRAGRQPPGRQPPRRCLARRSFSNSPPEPQGPRSTTMSTPLGSSQTLARETACWRTTTTCWRCVFCAAAPAPPPPRHLRTLKALGRVESVDSTQAPPHPRPHAPRRG